MLFFVDDPEGLGYNEYKTEDEARTAVEEALTMHEEQAAEDGEWTGYLNSLRWGIVMQKGREVATESKEGTFYEGKLVDV